MKFLIASETRDPCNHFSVLMFQPKLFGQTKHFQIFFPILPIQTILTLPIIRGHFKLKFLVRQHIFNIFSQCNHFSHYQFVQDALRSTFRSNKTFSKFSNSLNATNSPITNSPTLSTNSRTLPTLLHPPILPHYQLSHTYHSCQCNFTIYQFSEYTNSLIYQFSNSNPF